MREITAATRYIKMADVTAGQVLIEEGKLVQVRPGKFGDTLIFQESNGEEVGLSKASKTPIEFNITKYLKKGKNALAAQVFRWHDGSYLEDQDFWRLTGIERDVYLFAKWNETFYP